VSGVAKLQPVGHIWCTDQFNPAWQIPCTFFQAPRFLLWIAVQQHWLLPVSFELSATAALSSKQSYNSANKMVWYYCTTIHFINLFLHRLLKTCYIRPSSKDAISAIRWKSLVTTDICHCLCFCVFFLRVFIVLSSEGLTDLHIK